MRLVGLQRPAGAQRIPAADPAAGRALDRLRRPSRRHASRTRSPGRMENNGTSILDVTDPQQPEVPRAHPRRGRQGRAGRRADGARLQRRTAAARPTSRKFYLLRTFGNSGARDLGRHRSGEARAADDASSAASRARTRTGGSATPASPISSPATRSGAPRA